ncbi:hypothetical protein [Neochlamydia sp. S13]|uniref:hypothetical protein n=1 Tax=Neochlamydia sp. S13 TaxID=1353976 RepID=UPI0005AB864A|nr:hypothetical protein [Neochlamydia sp. S13]BBI17397.1 hypothetical protein NCS13_1_1202 [Neochlamydia sp. S13]
MIIKYIDKEKSYTQYDNQSFDSLEYTVTRPDGKKYSLESGEQTKFTSFHRILIGLKSLALTFFSLGLGMIYSQIREGWKEFFTGKRSIAVYKSDDLQPQSQAHMTSEKADTLFYKFSQEGKSNLDKEIGKPDANPLGETLASEIKTNPKEKVNEPKAQHKASLAASDRAEEDLYYSDDEDIYYEIDLESNENEIDYDELDQKEEDRDLKRLPISSNDPSSKPKRSIKDRCLERLKGDLAAINKEYGTAIDDGDCFFDAFAQALNKKLNGNLTLTDLRRKVSEYVNTLPSQDNWIKNSLEEEYGNIDSYESYVKGVKYNSSEAEKHGGYPIWGKSEIEGVILCHLYQVNLKVYEVGDGGDGVDGLWVAELEYPLSTPYDTTVELALYPGHFLPVYDKKSP